MAPAALHFWGAPACFLGSRSYEGCCLSGESGAADVLPARLPNGTSRCWTRSTQGWAEQCCRTDAVLRGGFDLPWARKNKWLQGCDVVGWDQALLAAKLHQDFLRAAWDRGRSRDGPQFYLSDKLEALWLSKPEDCQLGMFLVRLALLFLMIDGTELHSASAQRVHAGLLVDLQRIDADFASDELFAIVGYTPLQIRYALFGSHSMLPLPSAPFLPLRAFPQRGRYGSRQRVLEIGMGGGLNALVWLLHGFEVVGVEPSLPLLEGSVRPLLAAYEASQWFTVLHAAVVPADHPGGQVLFATHPTMPEESALVEVQEADAAVMVPAVSCGNLLRRLSGDILYLKCDAQGMDLACARDIDFAVAPPYASFELPIPLHDSQRVEEATALVRHLLSVGYTGFKVVSQRPYHASCHLGARCHSLALEHGMKLHEGWRCRWPQGEHRRCEGQPWTQGLSGPFGDAAVDWRRGEAWATAQTIVSEWEELRVISLRLNAHFDLHARRGL